MHMKKNSLLFHLLELNLAMLFISTSGILGRYISLPIPMTIGIRASLACLALFLFCKYKKFDLKIRGVDRGVVLLGGLLLGMHWVFYFYALQMSNVAIGMLSMFTYPTITTVLEPILLRTKLLKFHIFLGLLVLLGIYLLVPEFNLENETLKAVGFGVFSALCYAIRNIIMKSKVEKYNGSVLMYYQLAVVTALLLPTFFVLDSSQLINYLPAGIVLALLTTALGHTLFLYSFKNFSIGTASIISCIQPVYGIILGALFLNEYPAFSTIVGGSIIIISVVAESIRVYQLSRTRTQS